MNETENSQGVQSASNGSSIPPSNYASKVPITAALFDKVIEEVAAYASSNEEKKDTAFKRMFHQKRLQAFLVKMIIPEYKDYSIDDIIKIAIDPAAASYGDKDSSTAPGLEFEQYTRGGAGLNPDVRFTVKRLRKDNAPVTGEDSSIVDITPDDKPHEKGADSVENSEIYIMHAEGEGDSYITQELLNRSYIYAATEILEQIKPSRNTHSKYTNVHEVYMVWIMYGAKGKLQNSFVVELPILFRFSQSQKDLQPANKDVTIESDPSKKAATEILEKFGFDPKTTSIDFYNHKFNFQSLVHTIFIGVGDPGQADIRNFSELIYAMDVLFDHNMDENDKFSKLADLDIIKVKEEDTSMARIATAFDGHSKDDYVYYLKGVVQSQINEMLEKNNSNQSRENQDDVIKLQSAQHCMFTSFNSLALNYKDHTKFESRDDALSQYINSIGIDKNSPYWQDAIDIFDKAWGPY